MLTLSSVGPEYFQGKSNSATFHEVHLNLKKTYPNLEGQVALSLNSVLIGGHIKSLSSRMIQEGVWL